MRFPADVIVVGDALLDVYVAPSEPMRPGGDVPATVRLGPGGQGANVAVRLTRRGVRVRLACALADDSAGRLVREALEADRVELDAAATDATGAVVIVVDSDGERTMLSRRASLLPRRVEDAPWTVISGYVLLEDGDLDWRGGGRRAVLGCALPTGAEGTWWRRANELQPTVVILNADEAQAIGADARALALESGALVVVTDRDGAVATSSDPDLRPSRVTVERAAALDTTGAGDAFAAAFLAELHDRSEGSDVDIDRALTAGLELATQVAGVSGAQARVPLEQERSRA